jgi:hypothetical protein
MMIEMTFDLSTQWIRCTSSLIERSCGLDPLVPPDAAPAALARKPLPLFRLFAFMVGFDLQ